MFSALASFGLAVAVLATSFLSGIFGMLGGLILMGLLLAILPVPAAMALHAVTQMASNGWRALLWLRYVRGSVLPLYLLGSLLAFAILAWAALSPPKAAVYLALGGVPFLAVLAPARWAPDIRRPFAPLVLGFLVMALHVMAGVSGAVLDVFFVRTDLDRRQIVATKAMTQTIGHLLKFVYFTGFAIAAPSEGAGSIPLFVYGLAIAAAIIGTSSARFVLEGMSNRAFQIWSRRLVLVIGGVYLLRGLQLAWA